MNSFSKSRRRPATASSPGRSAKASSPNLRLRTPGSVAIAGTTTAPVAARGENPNTFFVTVAAGAPEIARVDTLGPVVAHPADTVDFPTAAGGVYEIMPVR
jgi:hypothetical protein